MATLNPYLNFRGNTEEAFNFYKSVFGGEFLALVRFRDMPHAGATAPEDADKLMHVSLPVGKGNVLMGTDVVGDMAKDFIAGNDFSLSLNADNKGEADTLFTALSAGGTVIVPIDNSPWGSYFGMLTDKFGIKWMVDMQLS